MTVDIGVLMAAVPLVGGAGVWAFAQKAKIDTHIAEDLVIHQHLKEQLEKIDAKTDKLESLEAKVDLLLARRRR